MKETRRLIEELQKTGFGPGLAYSVCLVDGVPEKIFVQKAENAARKYKLELLLSTSMTPATAPAENEEIGESSGDEDEEPSGSDEESEKTQEEEGAEGSGEENRSGNSSGE